MEAPELLRQLSQLASEAGLEVRTIRGSAGAEGEPDAASGLCRVRGATWVVLSTSDSLEERIDVVARALRACAPDLVETRYVPPALRALLSPDDEPA